MAIGGSGPSSNGGYHQPLSGDRRPFQHLLCRSRVSASFRTGKLAPLGSNGNLTGSSSESYFCFASRALVRSGASRREVSIAPGAGSCRSQPSRQRCGHVEAAVPSVSPIPISGTRTAFYRIAENNPRAGPRHFGGSRVSRQLDPARHVPSSPMIRERSRQSASPAEGLRSPRHRARCSRTTSALSFCRSKIIRCPSNETSKLCIRVPG
jgi:hypothetical protein